MRLTVWIALQMSLGQWLVHAEAGTDMMGAATLQGSMDRLIASETKLEGTPLTKFGFSVAVDGDTAVVGAWGDEGEEGFGSAGAAFVYVRLEDGRWVEQAKLTAGDRSIGDVFGWWVDISGDRIVVGAWADDVVCPEDIHCQSGSAYVYVREGITWREEAKLTPSDGVAGGSFGISAAIDGDTIVIGAPFIVDSAYIFRRDAEGWHEEAKFTGPDPAFPRLFGYAVEVDGDTVFVGVPGAGASVGELEAGVVCVFERRGETWEKTAELEADDAKRMADFGNALDISGDTLVVGAYEDDVETGVGDGSVYVFTREGSGWAQQAKLTPSLFTEGRGDRFGRSVAIDGDRVLVGASKSNEGDFLFSGSAFVFERVGRSWFERLRIVSSDLYPRDHFGNTVALVGDTAFVGVDNDASGERIGAYIYELGFAPLALDFKVADELQWTSLNFSGGGAAAHVAGAGLCIAVPAEGENLLEWDAPLRDYISLAPNTAYRVRFTMLTDQIASGEIPVWNILYRNFFPDEGIVTWGGERWFFDNAGGANGIGRANGLTEFEAWVVPAAVATAQWNGDVDPEDGAFSPRNAPYNAFGLAFRVLDLDSASGGAIGSQFDSGTICLRSVQVDAVALSDLQVDGAPLFGTGAGLDPNVEVLFATEGTAIDRAEGSLTIELGEPGGAGRAFVGFEDASLSGLARQFPIAWNDGELLRMTAEIVDPRPASGPAPVDVIALGWEAATDEIGGFDFASSGQRAGLFDRSASPRSIEETGGEAQKYTSLFYTHNSTGVDPLALVDANRLRAVLDFFNRDDLAGPLGDGNLSDPFQIRSLVVERVIRN